MERKHEKYERLIARCKALTPVPTAVAHPCDESSLRGAVEAAELGILQPILVGPRDKIEAVAAQFQLDISGYEIVDAPHSHAAAEMAVQLAREGKAEMLMKGSLHTDELMGAVVRTRDRPAHRAAHQPRLHHGRAEPGPGDHRHRRGDQHLPDPGRQGAHRPERHRPRHTPWVLPQPKVAILSAMETVNPKMPSTVEAAALCKMADRKQITGGILDGPLALDNAIDLAAAQIKKIDSPVAGLADILVVPDLEAGNMLAKSLSFMADADAAGIVLGARVPIILTSRADSVTTRLASCAVAALVAQARRAERQQGGGVMSDAILVLNAGSSSIKFSLFLERGEALEPVAGRANRRSLHRAPLQGQGCGGRRRRRTTVGRQAKRSGTTAPSPIWPTSCASNSASTGSPPSAIAWCMAVSTTRRRSA